MINPAIEQQIREQLDQMAPDQQRQVLDFARTVAQLSRPTGVPGTALLPFAGAIPPDDLRMMAQAIAEECERIDVGGW